MVFEKILIANRGEIAVRIIRTCKKMGLQTVVVHSEADSRLPFVEQADEAAFIGPAPAYASYLVKEKIIEIALAYHCQAVHPGYGFLSENPAFARMTTEAGLVFIGPSSEAIELLGDKMASKALARRVGIPVVPACPEPFSHPNEALRAASKMTFPLLLKPAAGGGGRGMRIVNKEEDVVPAFKACQEEAVKGFSDDRLFLEQYIPKPRHIEFQILADHHGNVIHLGERECSIQRRYQKVLEESPSLALDSSLRARIGGLSCDLARKAGYVNAGTVEFILDSFNNFYFLEMNTRLQVEHPVTEMVTGLDLVELQLRIAAGEHLPFGQEGVSLSGWAIEARICAENPIRDFFPTTGIVTRYAAPRGKGVRVDDGIAAGSVVTAHYDSMLSKVIVLGKDRDEAINKMVGALNGYHIEGLTTNVDFVNAVVDHPAFSAGKLSTDFIAEHFLDGQAKMSPDQEKIDYMVIAAVLVYHNRQDLVRQSLVPMSPIVGREAGLRKMPSYIVKGGEDVCSVVLDGDSKTHNWGIRVEERSYRVVTPEFEYYRRRLRLLIDESYHMFRLSYDQNHIRVFFCGIVRLLEIYSPLEWRLSKYMLRGPSEKEENELRCPMPGLVIGVTVKAGNYVRKGQEIFMIESMKMQSSILSPRDGTVECISVTVGQAVETDQVLIKFKA